MSTDVITIEAKPRERTGSRYSRRLRATGGLPAVVYGHKQTPVSVTLDAQGSRPSDHRGAQALQDRDPTRTRTPSCSRTSSSTTSAAT